jgi:hypothetical protein
MVLSTTRHWHRGAAFPMREPAQARLVVHSSALWPRHATSSQERVESNHFATAGKSHARLHQHSPWCGRALALFPMETRPTDTGGGRGYSPRSRTSITPTGRAPQSTIACCLGASSHSTEVLSDSLAWRRVVQSCSALPSEALPGRGEPAQRTLTVPKHQRKRYEQILITRATSVNDSRFV